MLEEWRRVVYDSRYRDVGRRGGFGPWRAAPNSLKCHDGGWYWCQQLWGVIGRFDKPNNRLAVSAKLEPDVLRGGLRSQNAGWSSSPVLKRWCNVRDWIWFDSGLYWIDRRKRWYSTHFYPSIVYICRHKPQWLPLCCEEEKKREKKWMACGPSFLDFSKRFRVKSSDVVKPAGKFKEST